MKIQEITPEKTNKYLRLGMILVIIAEVLFIIYMNLVKCTAYPEMDMAKLYRHAMEMVRNGSIVINGWNYISTMELDCSLLFAVPIYAMSGNIWLSFGIANLIFLAIYLFVIWDILKKLNVNPLYKYVSVIVFLIPYRMGMLEYFNMLFYNGGQYTVKVLVPLIIIDLLLEDPSGLFNMKNIKNILLLALMVIMMVITSMSSGTYVLMSGVVPIVGAWVLNLVLENRSTDGNGGLHNKSAMIRRGLILLASFISFVIGYALCRILHVSPNSEGMDLVTPHDFIDNIKVTIWGFFSVFVNPEAQGVTSLNGLMQLLRYVFAFLVIALIIYNLRHMFDRTEEAGKQRLLMFPFVITFIILSLTYCCFSDVYYPERYFFIGLVPIFLTIPYFLEAVSAVVKEHIPDNKAALPALFAILAALILTLIPISVLNVRTQIRSGYEGGYANVLSVLFKANSEGIADILWLYDLPDGEVARLFDPEIRSGVINFTEDGVPFIDVPRDFYAAAGEASYYPGPCIMADKDGTNFGRLPDDIKNACTAIGNTGGYELYMIDAGVFSHE